MSRTVIGKCLAISVLCLWLCPAGRGQDSRPGAGGAVGGEHFQLMRFLDRDRDRRIDAGELAAGQELASLLLMLSWDDCDQNADGWLAPGELAEAVVAARQELAEVDADAESQAEAELAKAVPLRVLLDRLAGDQRYAEEIAALREAVEDLDDEDEVITYITRYPARYPQLAPVIRVWGRYYPIRPGLHRHFWRRPPRPPAHVKPKPGKPKPGPKAGPKPKPRPEPKPPPKPKPGPKPKPKP